MPEKLFQQERSTISWTIVGALCALVAIESSNCLSQESPRKNRLAKESSPYLLQHAHNPVDWYPWGDEALAAAKAQGKLIFLSVGYSACHWCHVMEKESFVDQEIAKFLNEHFICVKVDREERPDVDQIYMTAVQMLSGHGGWPLSVFLTPDAKPIFGGTYFPARDGDRGNAPGFLTAIKRADDLWRTQRQPLIDQAELVTKEIRNSIVANAGQSLVLNEEVALKELGQIPLQSDQSLAEQFDPQFGGFGFAEAEPMRPKFPEPSNLFFLLQRIESKSTSPELKSASQSMLVKTLDMMLCGGIHDHLGGGFHRYSTDRFWRIPHFEKMLYDNGQLAQIYARAYLVTGREEYQSVARRICDFVIKELSSPGGGFYASLDADSEGEEGKFYVWSPNDLEESAKQIGDYEKLAAIYGLKAQPNFEGKFYSPQTAKSLTELAEVDGKSFSELDRSLVAGREKLLEVRNRRQRPATDNKILTSWNGLMIAGLADTGRLLKQPKYIAAAERAAEFILKELIRGDDRLLRTYAANEAKLNGYLDDYAFLVYGLLRLHEATQNDRWLDQAAKLTDAQIEHFHDAKSGGFFYTSNDHPQLIVRLSDPVDGAIPSGNSITAANLRYLALVAKLNRFSLPLKQVLFASRSLLERSPSACTFMSAEIAMWLEQKN